MSTITLPAPTITGATCAVGPVGSDGCRACLEACPYGAIELRNRPDGAEMVIDANACQRCGACSGVCPTSSIERPFLPAEELVTVVADAAAGVRGGILAITCGSSEARVARELGGDAVVVLPSLLIVDETILLAALGAGARGVVLVGCLACTHDRPRTLLDPLTVTRTVMDDPRRVAFVEDDGSTVPLRQALERMGALAPAPIRVSTDDRLRLATAHDRRERLRILLPRFGEGAIAPVAATGFGHITLDQDACVACGACAIACPTDTLQLDPSVASLSVNDLDCVGCGSCVAACPDDALTLEPAIPIGGGADTRRILLEDDSVACLVCGDRYAPQRLLDHARATLRSAELDPDDARFQLGICPTCRAADARTEPADAVRSDPGGCACGDGGSCDGEEPVLAGGVGRRSFLKGAVSAAAIGVALPLLGNRPAAAADLAAGEPAVITPGRMGMVIDLERCIGCHACTNVCKAENNVPLGKYRDWVEEHVLGEYPHAQPVFLPKLCNHCDDPGCLRSCPTGAIFKREDGIVDLDPDICIACQACMQGCPYGMTFYNHQRHTADKCNLCAHRIDEGLNPACVDVCPSQCRIVGDYDDPESPVSRYLRDRSATGLREDYGLGPNIQYVGLPGELNR
ncbi:MAG: 4Fe-4S dicluster domain-containing protein [Nitriliruptoraceae bacterium]